MTYFHRMLATTFLKLTAGYSSDRKLADSLWAEIIAKYSEPGRYYHTIEHLDRFLNELNDIRHLVSDWDAMLFAMYYHDSIYDPASGNNEEDSALLARERLASLGFPADRINACISLILATKNHAETSSSDINLFCDADMAILGSAPEAYSRYAHHVRKEYSIYPDFAYNPGRIKVLQHFLRMKSIFKTRHFFEKYEIAARANIERELSSLDS